MLSRKPKPEKLKEIHASLSNIEKERADFIERKKNFQQWLDYLNDYYKEKTFTVSLSILQILVLVAFVVLAFIHNETLNSSFYVPFNIIMGVISIAYIFVDLRFSMLLKMKPTSWSNEKFFAVLDSIVFISNKVCTQIPDFRNCYCSRVYTTYKCWCNFFIIM